MLPMPRGVPKAVASFKCGLDVIKKLAKDFAAEGVGKTPFPQNQGFDENTNSHQEKPAPFTWGLVKHFIS